MTQFTSKLEAVAIDWDWVLFVRHESEEILFLQVKIKSLYDLIFVL